MPPQAQVESVSDGIRSLLQLVLCGVAESVLQLALCGFPEMWNPRVMRSAKYIFRLALCGVEKLRNPHVMRSCEIAESAHYAEL